MTKKIGIICSDGEFSAHRSSELIGSEIKYIASQLGADVLSTNTRCVSPATCVDTFDNYDIIINFISSLNFFGGTVNPNIVKTFRLLHQFKGKVIAIYEDKNYPAKSLSNLLRGRKFWNENPLCDLSELELPPIHVAGMFKDFHPEEFKDVNVLSYTQIPIYMTHVDDRPAKKPKADLFDTSDSKDVDLIYGGFSRKGKRNKFYKEYFLNQKHLSVRLYGDLSKDLPANVMCEPRCPYQWVIAENARGLATVIPAEKGYNNQCVTPRIVEALMAGCLCFIENDFDVEHLIMKDDFFYVNSGDELAQKIRLVKSNPDLYGHYMDIQSKVLAELMSTSFKDSFQELINS